MKKHFIISLLFILLHFAPMASAQDAILPEVVAANKVTELTGIALNPLLVGGVMRGWRYWQTPEAQRSQLHWTAQPWFWGSLLSIGLLFLLNNSIGRIFPPTAKFMDGVETLEGKLAPLYTAPMMIPVGVELVQALDKSGLMPIATAAAADGGWQADPLSWFIGGGLAMMVLGIMWITNQAIHTIVLLCPVGALSMTVRFMQFAVLAILLLAAAIHPLLGAALALLLIAICARLVGWSFRLSVFGTFIAWDLCCWRRKQAIDSKVLCFSAAGLGIPSRSLGYLQQQATLVFCYRPWLILPVRQVKLTQQPLSLVQGVLVSQLHHQSSSLITFPPRYRGSEVALIGWLGCSDTRVSPFKASLQALFGWLKG